MQDNNKGFKTMQDQGRDEEVRDIAAEGGKAAHESGNANEFEAGSEDTRKAGSKGGKAAHDQETANEFNSETGSEAGKQSHKNDE